MYIYIYIFLLCFVAGEKGKTIIMKYGKIKQYKQCGFNLDNNTEFGQLFYQLFTTNNTVELKLYDISNFVLAIDTGSISIKSDCSGDASAQVGDVFLEGSDGSYSLKFYHEGNDNANGVKVGEFGKYCIEDIKSFRNNLNTDDEIEPLTIFFFYLKKNLIPKQPK